MDRTEAIAWVLSLATDLLPSQSNTLAHLVGAALGAGRATLAEIGRRLTGTSAKHGIKRCWRFTANDRVEVSGAAAGLVAALLKGKRWRKKRAVIALDWVEVRNFHTLVAALVRGGRAIPLLWASYPEWQLAKSQNNLEEGLLRLLKQMLPRHVRVVLLADRGFGRTEMARLCQQLGFHYVIRIRPDVWVKCEGFRGKLLDYPVKKGICRTLVCTEYRKKDPVEQRVVVRWKEGLPRRRDECWFLMTDLKAPARRLSELYAGRMTIEEFFRDGKSRRNGLGLRETLIKKAERFDRLLLVVVLAYVLLSGLGRLARRRFGPRAWCSNSRAGECSDFTVGRRMLERMQAAAPAAVAALIEHLLDSAPDWG